MLHCWAIIIKVDDCQVGDANPYWIVRPEDVVLPPGRYAIIDSDPESFALNAQFDGVDMAWLSGIPAD